MAWSNLSSKCQKSTTMVDLTLAIALHVLWIIPLLDIIALIATFAMGFKGLNM